VVGPDRLAIRGGSAGGLLVGACVTMRPDLFAAAVAEVPFVDVVTTMSDPTLPLTVTEWEEWGDPRSEPFASYMTSYSPYDNTVAMDYPATVRHRRPQRPAGELPRAGEVGGQDQDGAHQRGTAPAAHRDGRRPRRAERPLRRVADEARVLAFVLSTT
jgi:oligopeptidase B